MSQECETLKRELATSNETILALLEQGDADRPDVAHLIHDALRQSVASSASAQNPPTGGQQWPLKRNPLWEPLVVPGSQSHPGTGDVLEAHAHSQTVSHNAATSATSQSQCAQPGDLISLSPLQPPSEPHMQALGLSGPHALDSPGTAALASRLRDSAACSALTASAVRPAAAAASGGSVGSRQHAAEMAHLLAAGQGTGRQQRRGAAAAKENAKPALVRRAAWNAGPAAQAPPRGSSLIRRGEAAARASARSLPGALCRPQQAALQQAERRPCSDGAVLDRQLQQLRKPSGDASQQPASFKAQPAASSSTYTSAPSTALTEGVCITSWTLYLGNAKELQFQRLYAACMHVTAEAGAFPALFRAPTPEESEQGKWRRPQRRRRTAATRQRSGSPPHVRWQSAATCWPGSMRSGCRQGTRQRRRRRARRRAWRSTSCG